MHSWFVLILFGCLLVQILSRPQQAEYNNDSDLEEADDEEENEPAADEFLTDDDDTRLIEQDTAVQEEEVPRSRHLLDLTESRYLQRNLPDDRLTRTKTDNLSDSKSNRNRDTREESPGGTRYNEQMRSYPRRRQSNRYIEASDEQQEATQHLTNRDVNKSNRVVQGQGDNLVNKRTVEFEAASNEEGDMLFEKNRDQISKVDKNEYSNNDAEANDQSRYYKQYYNTMQAENREILEDKSHDNARYSLRDRRDVKQANPADTPNVANQRNKENNEKADSEDEESAIKRHIKKLSGDELDQLLNSLTDEKRELLKKIIDDVDASDNGFINKREITKKAGAVEENNFIENCQSDLSKVQGGSPVVDLNTEASPAANTETTEISKPPEGPTEGNEISSPKSAETSMGSVNKIELTNHIDEGVQKKTDSSLNAFSINIDPKNQGEMVANLQVTTKTETKREANIDDMDSMSFDDSKAENDMSLQNGQDYANDQGYFCPQDENLSKLLDDDSQVHQDGKPYKRDTYSDKQSDLSESMKSLEESFPNSNAYDDTVPYSGPLVRVKRKNSDQVIKKRSAGLLPDAKVAYFPYKAENEDEDNDEGNEFDDEGFYDRTSNFANSNKGLEEDTANAANAAQPKNSNIDNSKAPHENLESDTMSLGSDTDSVLSGVEGVDDNLMYSSGARNRRTAEENCSDTADVKSERSTSLLENEKSASENYFNAPHYQENDAFGPLPRNYDGDLARYKRIRRVKQSHNSQELAPSDG